MLVLSSLGLLCSSVLGVGASSSTVCLAGKAGRRGFQVDKGVGKHRCGGPPLIKTSLIRQPVL